MVKIHISYDEHLYHFIWIKGIIEILMGFVVLWFVRFNSFNPVFGTIMTILLIYSGIKDLQYFIRLKDSRLTE